MDVQHCLGAQAFRLSLRLDSVHSAFGQQLFVELLQFQSGQLPQLNFADIRLDVVVDVSSVGLVGGGATDTRCPSTGLRCTALP